MNEPPSTHRQVLERLSARVREREPGISTGPGWDGLLGRLDRELAAVDPGYAITQIKAKFGELRIYIETSPDISAAQRQSMARVVAGIERQASGMCETCGRDGTVTGVGGYYAVRCPAHVDADRRRLV